MPAIVPAKLKLQTARLAEHYSQPGTFVSAMHALLKIYADHTHRPGRSGAPSALTESYNTPPPVMRYISLAMKSVVATDPQGTLNLCDALWSEPYMEHRLLACELLGLVSLPSVDPILIRLRGWAQTILEPSLAKALIKDGTKCLTRKAPDTLSGLIEEWLNSPNPNIQKLGLRALISLIEEPHFQNLPGVFSLLTPFLRSSPSSIRPDLIELLEKLSLCSPSETAYALRSALGSAGNPDTAWLIRQVLPLFPEDVKNGLRRELASHLKKS